MVRDPSMGGVMDVENGDGYATRSPHRRGRGRRPIRGALLPLRLGPPIDGAFRIGLGLVAERGQYGTAGRHPRSHIRSLAACLKAAAAMERYLNDSERILVDVLQATQPERPQRKSRTTISPIMMALTLLPN
jgi:hypothetical protein